MTAMWIASRAERVGDELEDPPRAFDVAMLDRIDDVDDPHHRREGGIDHVGPIDRPIPMEDLLEDLGVCTQRLARSDRLLGELPGACLQRVVGTDEVHRNVRVDEDHPGSFVR